MNAAELLLDLGCLSLGSIPHLFWLRCVSSKSSLNRELAIIPRHLRGQGSKLIWACH